MLFFSLPIHRIGSGLGPDLPCRLQRGLNSLISVACGCPVLPTTIPTTIPTIIHGRQRRCSSMDDGVVRLWWVESNWRRRRAVVLGRNRRRAVVVSWRRSWSRV
ncbi:unnamed protein product [Rhodiola kirilowii]